MKLQDKKMGAYYNYDAAGERNLKLTGGIINVTQNGQSVYAPVFDQQTLYASALVTVNDKGYTKHYFEEGKRICSKIGSGELKNVFDPVPKIEKSYEEQRDIQVEGIHTTYSQCMNISPYIKNRNLYESIIKKYTNQINSSEPAFYYHSDHLGSASYITDSSGIQTQQLVYLPFGEDWVDKKYNVSQFQTPYKFNGKEKDQETGYNNYGARYLNTDLSIWLSVDPMSDKYPSTSSYAYCRNNPIMLVDPDGMDDDGWEINTKTGETKWQNSFGGSSTQHVTYSDGQGKQTGSTSLKGWGINVVKGADGKYSATNSPSSKGDYQYTAGQNGGTIQTGNNSSSSNSSSSNSKGANIASNISTAASYSGVALGTTSTILKSTKIGGDLGYAIAYSKLGKIANSLPWLGFGCAGASIAATEYQAKSGQISETERWIEHTSTGISSIPAIGTAWAAGWEIGRGITNIPGYHENVRTPLQKAIGIRP